MWKFEQSFQKAYHNKFEFHIEKIQKIMILEEYVEIPGSHMAIEIIQKCRKEILYKHSFFWVIAQFTVPVLASYLSGQPYFDNNYHKITFWL